MLEELAGSHTVIQSRTVYREGLGEVMKCYVRCEQTTKRFHIYEGESRKCPGCDYKLKVVADIRLYELS